MNRIVKALSAIFGREVEDPLIATRKDDDALTPAQRESLVAAERVRSAMFGPPQGAFSGKDGAEAIKFALEIDDHYEMRDFLGGWLEGDTREWPEFKPDLLVRPREAAK